MFALQAIETKYHGPTNTRGSRHSAITCEGRRRIRVDCPDELNPIECHAYAARKLAEKMGWEGRWYAGGTKAGYVFVCVPEWEDPNAVPPSNVLAFTTQKKAK